MSLAKAGTSSEKGPGPGSAGTKAQGVGVGWILSHELQVAKLTQLPHESEDPVSRLVEDVLLPSRSFSGFFGLSALPLHQRQSLRTPLGQFLVPSASMPRRPMISFACEVQAC